MTSNTSFFWGWNHVSQCLGTGGSVQNPSHFYGHNSAWQIGCSSRRLERRLGPSEVPCMVSTLSKLWRCKIAPMRVLSSAWQKRLGKRPGRKDTKGLIPILVLTGGFTPQFRILENSEPIFHSYLLTHISVHQHVYDSSILWSMKIHIKVLDVGRKEILNYWPGYCHGFEERRKINQRRMCDSVRFWVSISFANLYSVRNRFNARYNTNPPQPATRLDLSMSSD